jgi:hypothetical protein
LSLSIICLFCPQEAKVNDRKNAVRSLVIRVG